MGPRNLHSQYYRKMSSSRGNYQARSVRVSWIRQVSRRVIQTHAPKTTSADKRFIRSEKQITFQCGDTINGTKHSRHSTRPETAVVVCSIIVCSIYRLFHYRQLISDVTGGQFSIGQWMMNDPLFSDHMIRSLK